MLFWMGMGRKGWIALDIDGTVTLDKYSIPLEVSNYLRQIQKDGWQIAMATGRPLAFASMALSNFDFPYLFLAQNGSAVLEMPSQKVVFKRYIDPRHIGLVEEALRGIETDFLIYAGFEKGDFCYWRPDHFSSKDCDYLADLQKRQKEEWKAVKNFEGVGFFPLIKCFGPDADMALVAKKLQATGFFQVAKIKDPFKPDYFVLLITDKLASKGESLLEVFKLKGRGAHVIAAGDDENDLSLLQIADTKIAMAHAPRPLQEVATFIAPPTQDLGIIHALKLAIQNAN